MTIEAKFAPRWLLLLLLGGSALPACSIRGYALRSTADALSGTGGAFAEDNDPALVREAVPFGLKTMEALAREVPDHPGLPVSLASGFTQYGYAFVQQDADRLEDKNLAASRALRQRARNLYLRARDHALRGLEVAHPGFEKGLRDSKESREAALAKTTKKEVPLLYWSAASWALAVSNSKDNPDLIGDLPLVEALIARAVALDPEYDQGVLHEFYVSYDASRSEQMGGGPKRVREHLAAATKLSQGRRLGVRLSYAEGVLVAEQKKAEFKKELESILAINVNQVDPAWRKERLANTIVQERARFLLGKLDELFLE